MVSSATEVAVLFSPFDARATRRFPPTSCSAYRAAVTLIPRSSEAAMASGASPISRATTVAANRL